MLLPQSSAFAALKNRLNSVSNIGLLHAGPRLYVYQTNPTPKYKLVSLTKQNHQHLRIHLRAPNRHAAKIPRRKHHPLGRAPREIQIRTRKGPPRTTRRIPTPSRPGRRPPHRSPEPIPNRCAVRSRHVRPGAQQPGPRRRGCWKWWSWGFVARVRWDGGCGW